mmetsp:Transcript_9827/g.19943  ORF Transcript_9827/g.19943 Transcript_9827/m.19943 type:complete len:215 (+) Transcript_9827:1002-1646(+)
MSAPSRLKSLEGFTVKNTYRSPGGPPLGPASPSLRMRRRLPLSTPGGMVIMSCFAFWFRPRPEHDPQYSSMICPVPWHVGHAICCCSMPNGVRATCVTTPDPPQFPHVRGCVPGFMPEPSHVSQVSKCEIRIFSSPPKMACLKSISRSSLKSSPCCGPDCRRRPPGPPTPPWPPKKVSKISPNGLKSPKSENPGPAPAAPFTPASPNWSYIAFF